MTFFKSACQPYRLRRTHVLYINQPNFPDSLVKKITIHKFAKSQLINSKIFNSKLQNSNSNKNLFHLPEDQAQMMELNLYDVFQLKQSRGIRYDWQCILESILFNLNISKTHYLFRQTNFVERIKNNFFIQDMDRATQTN